MNTFKDRLIEEKAQLDDKIQKLQSFMESENFSKIDPVQMSLLNVQIFAMQTYSQVLAERLLRL